MAYFKLFPDDPDTDTPEGLLIRDARIVLDDTGGATPVYRREILWVTLRASIQRVVSDCSGVLTMPAVEDTDFNVVSSFSVAAQGLIRMRYMLDIEHYKVERLKDSGFGGKITSGMDKIDTSYALEGTNNRLDNMEKEYRAAVTRFVADYIGGYEVDLYEDNSETIEAA